MSDRETFEKWAGESFPKMHLTRKGDTGEYLYKTAEFAWQAWQEKGRRMMASLNWDLMA